LRTFWGANVRGPPVQTFLSPSLEQLRGSTLTALPEIHVALLILSAFVLRCRSGNDTESDIGTTETK
jgi:hypothetical protein